MAGWKIDRVDNWSGGSRGWNFFPRGSVLRSYVQVAKAVVKDFYLSKDVGCQTELFALHSFLLSDLRLLLKFAS